MICRKMLHFKCRNNKYPFGNIERLKVTNEQVPWNYSFNNYHPPVYNSANLNNKSWADPDLTDINFKPKWNNLDGKINRRSHIGEYLVTNGTPLNILGRTGLKGRGVLGKWGPNHAADPIVTRWKLNKGKIEKNQVTSLPILQFCAIQRKDCNEWAIPGGMVDPGENINETLKREFLEEAFNSLEADSDKAKADEAMINEFFKKGENIYKGYVDDPRNTDNAWMETVAVNFHDDTGDQVGKFLLQAGDDAKNVRWMDIDRDLSLYASHVDFIKLVIEKRKAHW